MVEQSRSRWFLHRELMEETHPAFRWLFIATIGFLVLWLGVGFAESWRLWSAPPSIGLDAFVLGNELLDRGDYELAEREYRALEEITPWSTTAIRNRARILKLMGDEAASLAAFARAVEMGPLDPTTHYDFGVAQYQSNDVDGAIESFDTALGIEPSYYEALEALGSAQIVSGHATLALEAFERAVALRGDSHAALRGVGAAHAMKGQWREATAAYRAALALAPNDPDLQRRLQEARQKLGGEG